MHVIEPSFLELPFIESVNKDEIKRQLTEKIDHLNKVANLNYILFVESGSIVGTITNKAAKTKADLLVIGTHGKDDIRSNYFGSIALKLIQKTHIPVLIVKNEAKNIYQEIVAPTNLSDYSKESILFANTLFSKSSRNYLHVYESVDEVQALRYQISIEQLHKFKLDLFSDAKIASEKFMKEIGEGKMNLLTYKLSINEDLLEYIIKNKSDLLVLGSKGVNDLNSFVFGSTASYLIQRSPIDVLAYVPVTANKNS